MTELFVLGGTPGGIATAVRAAREGHDVCLGTYNDHLGGMMAGGLSYTDTLTMKARAPLLEEFTATIRDHYRDEYGEYSEQYGACENGYVFEPHVAEAVFDSLVGDESSLEVRTSVYPVSVERSGSSIKRVVCEPFDTGDRFTIEADVFVDATYEGDALATAGASYRLGRESRSEFDEQFAGKLFTQTRGDRYYPREAVGEGDHSAPADRGGPLDIPPEKRTGELNLVPHPGGLTEIYPKSTGEADDAIQAYNYRLCLSRDPDNRRYPEKPDGYDRSEYVQPLEEIRTRGFRSYLLLRYLPNDKADMNSADLPGENHEYPTADWKTRDEIADRHRTYALGLLYFLQNDDEVPEGIQQRAKQWGLAADEFTDTDNFPWQLYVREGRRLEGRYVFTENDARYAPGLGRAPINKDSIAIGEYPLDSHACVEERQLGSRAEGNFFASQVTRPSQIPYRTLLPRGIDNLIVPVALSATHAAYGTIRLEPTWMHIGESAGFAASQALATETPPAEIDVDRLQQTIVERGVMISFFNEFDMHTSGDWVSAVQYFGAKGFFDEYNAKPDDVLLESVANQWVETAAELCTSGEIDAGTRARVIRHSNTGEPISRGEFRDIIDAEFDLNSDRDATSVIQANREEHVTRGDACRVLYDLCEERHTHLSS